MGLSLFSEFQSRLRQPQHAGWVVLQQAGVRGLQAGKFLIAARLLGPENIGLVGIALICLAIAEGMSDTGLAQAVVQSKRTINRRQAGALWTLQLVRGLALAVGLFVLSSPIAWAFGAVQATGLVAMAGLVALLRNCWNPGLFLYQRKRNFRSLCIYETGGAIVDIAMTILLIQAGIGPSSVLLGSIAGESVRVLITWTWFRLPIRPSLHWGLIIPFTSFGKWVWGSSVITLLLNQLDKILVARFLGTVDLGLYQVASRVAQLFISDGATAMGTFLYPTFSEAARRSRSDAAAQLRKYASWIGVAVAVGVVLLLAFANVILTMTLGGQWLPAAPVLRVLSVAMLCGALITILVAYVRATGRPQAVVIAVALQLAVFLPSALLFTRWHGAVGMATATCLGAGMALAYLTWRVKPDFKTSGTARIPVLITCAINASAGMTRMDDPKVRLAATLAAISQWLQQKSPPDLVVCDGSGFDFSREVEHLAKGKNARIEFLCFDNGSEAVRDRGKGYGEGEIVGYALETSNLLSQAPAFAKCTGKLWVENFGACIAGFNGVVALDFNGWIKPRFVDTRFYIVSKAFYVEHLSGAHRTTDEDGGFYLEHAFLHAMHGTARSRYAMRPTPRIRGISGSMGSTYPARPFKEFFRDCRSAALCFIR